MPNFKLNITYNIDANNSEEALGFARILLLEQHIHGSCIPDVTLNRDGDRSAANLLAPINDKHFKHQKIPITEYPGYKEYYQEELCKFCTTSYPCSQHSLY